MSETRFYLAGTRHPRSKHLTRATHRSVTRGAVGAPYTCIRHPSSTSPTCHLPIRRRSHVSKRSPRLAQGSRLAPLGRNIDVWQVIFGHGDLKSDCEHKNVAVTLELASANIPCDKNRASLHSGPGDRSHCSMHCAVRNVALALVGHHLFWSLIMLCMTILSALVIEKCHCRTFDVLLVFRSHVDL